MTHDPAHLAAMLMADRYCIIENAIPSETIGAVEAELGPRFAETPFCEGGFNGARTKRFGALLRRSAHVTALVQQRLVLTIAETVLGRWCERIILNLSCERN